MHHFREEHSIIDWLGHVSFPLPKPHNKQNDYDERSKKRKYDHDRPLSPPTSLSNSIGTKTDMVSPTKTPQTRKKRKANDANTEDQDATPTQARGILNLDDSDTFSLSSASVSQTSNRSSPTRLFPQLSLYPKGLERKPMDLRDRDLPYDLVNLIKEMKAIQRGRKVVPACLKPTIELKMYENEINSRLYSDFDDSVYDYEDNDWAGPDSLIENVMRTVDIALDCDSTQQDETGWNHLVHSPLLDLTLDRLPRNLVSFVPCMGANITARYRIPQAPGARVDYAMFINPKLEDDPRIESAIKSLQRGMPEASVNHTTFTPLNKRPISVSIETKRLDGSGDKAVLQIGIWQAAQWKLLFEHAGDAVNKLSFIPGLVVEGHEWKLVATTYKEGRTVLWTSQNFGDTLSPLDRRLPLFYPNARFISGGRSKLQSPLLAYRFGNGAARVMSFTRSRPERD
ncbi:hypothetical protein FANTH_14010 [Fusarium anthophilum]|uniref:PD-(D/E)XK nuclease-like domain-containing protein n=1 Tax=Fusarium anthophilum TaxID=48485 RepID=A0A8H5DNK7_9HYPO|nr:hypothetical protein FANTH_14010 [Fusarium anthophilum]